MPSAASVIGQERAERAQVQVQILGGKPEMVSDLGHRRWAACPRGLPIREGAAGRYPGRQIGGQSRQLHRAKARRMTRLVAALQPGLSALVDPLRRRRA